MKLRKLLATATAVALATSGLAVTAASALDSKYVPLADIEQATEDNESDVYNS